MNERFQELHNQARDFYLQDEYMDLSMKDLHRLVEQKFSELIVQECAEHALTFNNNLQSLNDKEIRSHSSKVSDYIKDRMGVEE